MRDSRLSQRERDAVRALQAGPVRTETMADWFWEACLKLADKKKVRFVQLKSRTGKPVGTQAELVGVE